MKKLILLVLITTFSCSSKPTDCSNFRTGIFKYKHKDYSGHVIERNDSIQIEYNDTDDIKIISKIEWASDCEYILTYKDILNYPQKDNVIGKSFNVKIIETKNSSYICHVKSNTLDSEVEIVKVK